MGDSNSTVIIDVNLNAADANLQATRLGGSIKTLKDEQKKLAAENKQTGLTYQTNAQQLQQLQREQKSYIQIANSASGSNTQQRAQLSLLTKEYDNLSREQRETVSSGKALEVQIAAINRELLKSEGTTGRFQRNVGNYQSGLGSTVQTFASSAASAAGTAGGFGFLPQALSAPFTAFKQTVTDATIAVKAQQTANELLRISNEKSTATSLAQAEAEAKGTAALEAKAQAELATARAAAAQTASEEALIAAQVENLAIQEREAALIVQLAAETEALAAIEAERTAIEQALLATQAELTASEAARAAQEVELASATVSNAAASEAAAAKNTVLSGSFSVLGGVIVAALLIAGTAVASFLSEYDSFTDGLEQQIARAKAGFHEIGSIVSEVFSGNFSALDGARAKIRAASDEAAHFTEIFQNLQDLTDINELQNQQVQNEVQLLRLQAKNRKESAADKAADLAKADKLERDQFTKTQGLHATIIDEGIAFAKQQNAIRNRDSNGKIGLLSQSDIEALRNGDLQIANNALNAGKITKTAYEKLKKDYETRNSDLQESNANLEKIQNDRDKYQLQADKKAEEAQKAREKSDAQHGKNAEEIAKSKLATAAGILTDREQEFEKINIDIDKREQAFRKYGQVTEQLEKERASKIGQLNTKFNQQNLKDIEKYVDEAAKIRISQISDPEAKKQAEQEQANRKAIQAVDDRILAIAARMAMGEQGLTDILKAAVDNRSALTEKGNHEREESNKAMLLRIEKGEEQGKKDYYDGLLKQAQFEKDQNDARLKINKELLGSYETLASGVEGFLGKQTIAGKLAFVAQKGFAIAQILINGELAKSEIFARYEILKRQAALGASIFGPAAPFVSAAAILGLTAAEGVEIGKITAQEIIQSAIVGASAISGLISGKAKGGVQGLDYKSDGKGTALPGYSTYDNLNAYLRAGEGVVVSEAMQDPHTRNLISAINVAYGGRDFSVPNSGRGYALGGTYSGSAQQSASNDIAGQIMVANSNMLNMLSSLKLYVAVTDINDGQNNYAKIVQSGNF